MSDNRREQRWQLYMKVRSYVLPYLVIVTAVVVLGMLEYYFGVIDWRGM